MPFTSNRKSSDEAPREDGPPPPADGASVLERLAGLVSATRVDELPVSAVEAARLRILDYLGTALNASRHAPLAGLLEAWAGQGGPGEAVVIGDGRRLPAARAALLNTYPHLSDGSRRAGGHCAWVAVPAALAVAEREGASGSQFLLAVVLAYEVLLRIGWAIYPEAHQRGFSPTSVRGAIGAAAAASRLTGFDARTTTAALSIAAAASGVVQAADSPWPLYCLASGRATEAGVLAAEAAGAGVPGRTDLLEAGFLVAYGRSGAAPGVVEGLGDGRWAIESTYLKLHFGCRHSHPAIDACIELSIVHDLAPEDVTAVRLSTYPLALELCGRRGSTTAADAAYDLPMLAAIALVHRRVSLAEIEAGALASPVIQELAGRVEVEVDPGLAARFPEAWPVRVEIETVDGRRLSRDRDLPRGEPEDPFGRDEIVAKFESLAAATLDARARQRLIDRIEGIEELPGLGPLTELLGRPKR